MQNALPFAGRIDKYELVRLIGEGGMGQVYLARHERLRQRSYAIKLMRTVTNTESRARFEREIDALDGLTHPNIVSVVDAGDVSGTPFLVMEHVDGVDLRNLLKRQSPLPIADACRITAQVAKGLQHVHDRGLVHRDIKPANVLLSMDGVCKILDLGLARLFDDDQDPLTSTNQLFGTPDYMSPEQCGGDADIGPLSDVYSLGCTLYCLLAGRPPFATDNLRTAQAKMRAHLVDTPVSLRSLRPEIPAPRRRARSARAGW